MSLDTSHPTSLDEVLRRHVVDSWMADDEPMRVAFRPTVKDERKLSTDCDVVTPRDSFDGYATRAGHPPDSTWPIVVETALNAHMALDTSKQESGKLAVIHDGGVDGLHTSHVSIAFSDSYDGSSNSATKKADERIAKRLRDEAVAAGCLYRPV